MIYIINDNFQQFIIPDYNIKISNFRILSTYISNLLSKIHIYALKSELHFYIKLLHHLS